VSCVRSVLEMRMFFYYWCSRVSWAWLLNNGTARTLFGEFVGVGRE
jgi:hypothetical protein